MAKDIQIGLRVDEETQRKFLAMCEIEHRSQSDQFAYLVDRAWVGIVSVPNPLVMVGDLTDLNPSPFPGKEGKEDGLEGEVEGA